jgi:hypothetical protein
MEQAQKENEEKFKQIDDANLNTYAIKQKCNDLIQELSENSLVPRRLKVAVRCLSGEFSNISKELDLAIGVLIPLKY